MESRNRMSENSIARTFVIELCATMCFKHINIKAPHIFEQLSHQVIQIVRISTKKACGHANKVAGCILNSFLQR